MVTPKETEIKFQTSDKWVTNHIELTRLIEHVMDCVVELNQKNREIITWTEHITDAIERLRPTLPSFKIENGKKREEKGEEFTTKDAANIPKE